MPNEDTHSRSLPTQARVSRDARLLSSKDGLRLISTHEDLFDWLAAQLPEATPKIKVARFFVQEAFDVGSSFECDGRFFLDQWTLHYFFHVVFREQFKKKETCREALLWFLSQVYATAAVENGLSLTREMANQIAIRALHLDPNFIRIGEGEIRSTKRCRKELSVSIHVALEGRPYEEILL